MIQFNFKKKENASIKLFDDFLTLYGDGKPLADKEEAFNIVLNGDSLVGIFYGDSPFEINGKNIYYNENIINACGLTENESYACIAHELGHAFDHTPIYSTNREYNADQFAKELKLGQELISVLKKFKNTFPDKKIDFTERIQRLE